MTRPALRVPEPRQYSRILSIGGVRGERVVPNSEIIGPIDSSDEWIQQRTGIVTRRYAQADVSVADMAEQAARIAMDDAGLTGADIGLVIVSTVTHFQQTPSVAAIIADRLGITPSPAFDASAACAGYCYAIAQADALVRAGTVEHVLVVGVEKMSDYIDPTDRTISFLLGDGAGAAIVGPSDTPGISRTLCGSDGSRRHLIRQTDSFLEYRRALAAGTELPEWPTLRQEGPSVYKWVVFQMTEVALQTITEAGLSPQDIDVFIPHQANMRIVDHMVKKLGLRDDVVVADDIKETGNTSAASIPLAAERLLREGRATSGDVALQIGFGAGLVYAAQVVVLP